MVYTQKYASPLGGMLLAADEVGLTGLWFDGEKFFADNLPAEHELPDEVRACAKPVENVVFLATRAIHVPERLAHQVLNCRFIFRPFLTDDNILCHFKRSTSTCR